MPSFRRWRPGRSLAVEEAGYVTDMARRIAAILLRTPQLDPNYAGVKHASFEWRSGLSTR